MARFDALIERWGMAAVMLLGALILLTGLGSTGLWEPWEMDRADLSRTLAEPPRVVAALGAPEQEATVRRAVSAAGAALHVVDRDEPAAAAPRRDSAAVQSAIDDARARVVAAVVLDLGLLLPDADDATGWKAAAARVSAAIGYVPNGRVVLLDQRGLSHDELASRFGLELTRVAYERASDRLGLKLASTPEEARRLDAAIAAVASRGATAPRLTILTSPASPAGATFTGLEAAIADAVAAHSGVVRFKDRGVTVTAPPLDAWLRTAAFRALGPTELAARLPAALLGLLALWILMLTARNVWGYRVALLAGVVLVTMPLFFGQARSAAGEPGAILALTLVGCGLLMRERGAAGAARAALAYLAAGFVIGFLAKGLFAVALFSTLALAVPLVQGSRQLRAWVPGLAFAALSGLLAWWVLSASPDGFAGQFRFTAPLFTDGPPDYARNFDLVLRELGFGLFPWSPLVVVAVGALIFHALRDRDGATLTLALWFAIPTAVMMATLKDFNQLIWPAAPATALAVALLLAQLAQRGARSAFVAFSLVVMAYLLQREIGQDAQPLVDFLTVDPPFADKGDLRFPDDLHFSGALRGLGLLGILLCALHFGRLATFARQALIYFRRERPFAIALGAVLVLAPLYWLVSVGDAHRIAAGQAHAATLGAGQGVFIANFRSWSEPAFLLGIATVALLALTLVFRWIFPAVGRVLARVLPTARSSRGLMLVGALIWAGLAVTLTVQTSFPHDYLAELVAPTSLLAYLAVIGLVFAARRVRAGDRLTLVAVAVAGLSLLVITRLVRDADWREWWVALTLLVGWAPLAAGVLAQLVVRVERFAIGAGLLTALCLLAVVVPLFDRWDWVEQVLYPGSDSFLTGRLVIRSVGTWLVYLAIVTLVVNRHFHDELARFARHGLVLERGRVAVASVAAVALVVTVGTAFGFHRDLAANVSQKHVIDAWSEVAGDSDGRLFKHGAFAAQGRKDANFYTAGLPEIRDRQAALEVLLGARDQVAMVDHERGSEPLVLPGFSPANDRDGDGRRDRLALRGFLTGVDDATLTDATQRWTPNALVGRRLVDIDGRTWEIVANDATSVTVDPRVRLTFAQSPPARRFYAIDAAGVADHRATGEQRERRGLLIPAGSLSEINFAFRRLSGGRHLPILEGTSYRVLLATSWLEPGETQENRIANAVYTQADFDALADPRVRRVTGNFDDEIQVVGYLLHTPVASKNSSYRITVFYKALRTIRRSYKIFMHMDLQGATERIHGDHWPLNPVRETEDNKNCVGCFRTDHWLPGDIVADTFDVDVGAVASGDYMIWVGFYQPGPDTRLVLKSWDRELARHDGQNRLGLGTFQVR